MFRQTISTVWPSGLEKPIMQLNLDTAATTRMTGLEFERVLEDMGYEYFAGCEVPDFGPVLFHAGAFRNVNIYVDSRCPADMAIEKILLEFRIPSDASYGAVETRFD